MRTQQDTTVQRAILKAIESYGLPLITLKAGQAAYRVQPIRHRSAVFYNRVSDSRYGDPQQQIGVYYLALSDNAAVAETLQSAQDGPGAAVAISELDALALHRIETTRPLHLVDTGQLARQAGAMLDSIVRSKGQGRSGYAYTQTLSGVVMRNATEVDGLLYPSRVWPVTGSYAGCNLALFEGRPRQVREVEARPLDRVVLSCGDTLYEFLERIGVPVE